MNTTIDLYDYIVSHNLAIAEDMCAEDFPNQSYLHNAYLEDFEIDDNVIEICLEVYSKVANDTLVADFVITLTEVVDKNINYTDDQGRLVSLKIDNDVINRYCTRRLLVEVDNNCLVIKTDRQVDQQVNEKIEEVAEESSHEKSCDLSYLNYPSKWVFNANNITLEWQWLDSPNSDQAEYYDVNTALFLEWRFPRPGDNNPTKIRSKVWEWLVHSKRPACSVADAFDLPTTYDEAPGWCFDRLGQSVTLLPDHSLVYIAGEHEDWYDHNFFIYNDVVVVKPDQSVVFYCYPKNIFSPTDFHTATLVDDKIVIIGNLGYLADHDKNTQIYVLDLRSYVIEKITAVGISPGWIHKHEAILNVDGRSIIIRKGLLDVGGKKSLRENCDDWKLWLDEWRWEKLTDRQWVQWGVVRSDKKRLHFWEYRQALWAFNHDTASEYHHDIAALKKELALDPDIQLISQLYEFSLAHKQIEEDDDEYNVFWLELAGVRIKFVEKSSRLQVIIQGFLASETIKLLQSTLIDKVSVLENALCEMEVYE